MQHLFEALTGNRQAHHHVHLSASIHCTSSGSTHLWQRVELGENDPTLVDTINGDLVRRVGVLWVWSSMPVASKVDTASVDAWTRDNESWGGGQYNVDEITTYHLS